ncbi:MAG: PQQ-binding-like beta-propeller repeat protein, partial [Planctomycetota bacterium]
MDRLRHALSVSLTAALLAVCSLSVMTADANEWPQWQGPNRDLTNEEAGLMKSWPEDGPQRVWFFENAGEGYSGPAIVDGRLYTMGARNGVAELIVLDAKTGAELWSHKLAEKLVNGWGDGPRGTPTVDGYRVYCLTAAGTLACLSTADGELIWQKTMQTLGGAIPKWGYSESPLIDGDEVLITPGGELGAIFALDKQTGSIRWR